MTCQRSTRFTIAHEIVHTLFFDMSEGMPKAIIPAAHQSELKALERTCDTGANRLLLPKERLSFVLSNESIMSPGSIIALSRRFHVSIESLMIRLGQLGSWGTECGAIFLVDSRNATPTIEAMAVDSFAQAFFPIAEKGTALKSLLGMQELTVFGGDKDEVSQLVSLSAGRSQEFHFACEPCNPAANRFVVTARLGAESQYPAATAERARDAW